MLYCLVVCYFVVFMCCVLCDIFALCVACCVLCDIFAFAFVFCIRVCVLCLSCVALRAVVVCLWYGQPSASCAGTDGCTAFLRRRRFSSAAEAKRKASIARGRSERRTCSGSGVCGAAADGGGAAGTLASSLEAGVSRPQIDLVDRA